MPTATREDSLLGNLGVAVLLLLVLGGGAALFVYQHRAAEHARMQAVEQHRRAAESSARAVAAEMLSLIERARDPAEEENSVMALIDAAAGRVERESPALDAAEEASVREILARAYEKAGAASRAVREYERILELARSGDRVDAQLETRARERLDQLGSSPK